MKLLFGWRAHQFDPFLIVRTQHMILPGERGGPGVYVYFQGAGNPIWFPGNEWAQCTQAMMTYRQERPPAAGVLVLVVDLTPAVL